MQLLLDLGADFESNSTESETTPLMYAAGNGHDRIIEVRSEVSESALMFVQRRCSTKVPALTLWIIKVTQRFTTPQLTATKRPSR